MTIEEAIKHGTEQLEIFGGEHKDFIELAIEALEKQIPKRVNYGKTLVDFHRRPYTRIGDCPNCGTEVNANNADFCRVCGQRIDWDWD